MYVSVTMFETCIIMVLAMGYVKLSIVLVMVLAMGYVKLSVIMVLAIGYVKH